jgi:polysaccharide biosynthesis protein PelA
MNYRESKPSQRIAITARWMRMLVVCLLGLATRPDLAARTFAVNYHAEPEAADLLAVDLTILQPEAKVDLKVGQSLGKKYLAYLSLVEVHETASYRKAVEALGVPLVGENTQWKSLLADIRHPKWAEFLVGTLAKQAMDKGFDGFFLDTADSIALLAKQQEGSAAEYRTALVSLINSLRAAYPKQEIILNRGFEMLPELKGKVDGVLVESVFQTFDEKGAYGPVAAADHQALVNKIRELRTEKMPVYVVDYLAKGNELFADSVVEQIRKLGAEPFLTTKELQGVMLGPIKREARRILVLYGSVLAESEVAEKFAADTFTAERLQMPLEWLGYEVEYLNIGKVSPPAVLEDRFCGIIFDVETQLPYGGEAFYVDWILEQKKRGLKLLFTGQYPFQQDIQRIRMLKGLGVWGSYTQAAHPEKVEFRKVNRDLMSYEGTLTAHPAEIEDSRAPEGAQVDVSVSCTDQAANQLVFDAVFTTDWGGALMDPYATFQASADDQASLFDPFKFLSRLFPNDQFPAPDPTTRDGQRIFYSHIDGDGFCGVTGHAGTEICGAVIRDFILKKYPFPITCSLVEASMRGWETTQKESDAPYYEEIARTVFALPNVQAASHAFSHPYVWIDHDQEFIPLYEKRGLDLKPVANYDVENPSMEREVRGSIEYIQKLCPPGKRVDLMLWSGNCRPSPEALRICREMNVENMNGGNTVISKRHPFLSNVSPRVMLWDDEMQIHAANQNEFVYTKNWSGPYYGGFSQVIETFDATESPRRLKPVNIYYHFYSAMTLGSLRALEKIHDWCLERPLHSMTTADYARLIRDSYHTKIYQSGPRSWVLINEGQQRTFRIPATLGVPDFAASNGVIGYRKINDQHYIHTAGKRVTQLTLKDANTTPHLYLESSQGSISWQKLEPAAASLTVRELRPKHELVFAGSKPGASWKAVVNGAAKTITADDAGRIVFELNKDATIQLSLP